MFVNRLKSISILNYKTLSFCLCTFICACNPYQQYISEIDTLEVTIDSLQKIYTPINFDTIKQSIQKISVLEDSLKKCISDSTTLQFYEAKMAPAANLKKSMNRWKKSYLNGGGEFEYSKTQLQNLKEDIQHKLLEESAIIKYLETEKTAISQLKDYVEKTVNWHKQALNTYPNVIKNLESSIDSCLIRQNQ